MIADINVSELTLNVLVGPLPAIRRLHSVCRRCGGRSLDRATRFEAKKAPQAFSASVWAYKEEVREPLDSPA